MATRLKYRRTTRLLVVTSVALIPFLLFAYSGGPDDGLTGAPGEGLCTNCHSGNPDDGSVEIMGAPLFYELDKTYTVTVTIQDQGQSRWGFELTAKDETDNGAGTFAITDSDSTQLSDNPAPSADYVKHTSLGTHNGTPDGPISWKFDWTAPSSNVGDITFYVAGNAANGNGSTSGDNIYTATFVSKPDEVPSISQIGLVILVALILASTVLIVRRRRCIC
jgi:hypothetical protein